MLSSHPPPPLQVTDKQGLNIPSSRNQQLYISPSIFQLEAYVGNLRWQFNPTYSLLPFNLKSFYYHFLICGKRNSSSRMEKKNPIEEFSVPQFSASILDSHPLLRESREYTKEVLRPDWNGRGCSWNSHNLLSKNILDAYRHSLFVQQL